jgi:hypothetical protein
MAYNLMELANISHPTMQRPNLHLGVVGRILAVLGKVSFLLHGE